MKEGSRQLPAQLDAELFATTLERLGLGARATERGPRPLALNRLKSERHERNKFPSRRRVLQRSELVSHDQISRTHCRIHSRRARRAKMRCFAARASSSDVVQARAFAARSRRRAGANRFIRSSESILCCIASTSSPTLRRVTECVESFPFDSSCRNTSGVRSHRANPLPQPRA